MFTGEAGAYPRVKHNVLKCMVGSGLPHKLCKTSLEKLARDKRSSLLWKVITYGCKKIYNIGPWSLFYKNITIVNDASWVTSEWRHNMERHLQLSITLLELSTTLPENIYSTGITHDDGHVMIVIWLK